MLLSLARRGDRANEMAVTRGPIADIDRSDRNCHGFGPMNRLFAFADPISAATAAPAAYYYRWEAGTS
jgi:hypothetical protein